MTPIDQDRLCYLLVICLSFILLVIINRPCSNRAPTVLRLYCSSMDTSQSRNVKTMIDQYLIPVQLSFPKIMNQSRDKKWSLHPWETRILAYPEFRSGQMSMITSDAIRETFSDWCALNLLVCHSNKFEIDLCHDDQMLLHIC